MIPSSDLYRIPRGDAVSRNADAERYARSEYGAASLSWMFRTRPATNGLWARLVATLGGLLGRPTRVPARTAPLRTGAAAVHFAGEPTHPHGTLSRPHSHPLWDAHPAGTLLLPAPDADPTHDVCECDL